MKKFLTYSLLFVLPFLIAAISMEYVLRQVPNPYQYKYDWMQENAEDVEILVLGSSHTFYGIRPEFFDGKAFNLANVSQGPKQDLYLLEYWANQYRNLKTVIIPISCSSWWVRDLEYSIESYRCRYYKIYMDCDLYPDLSLHNLEISDWRTAKGKLTRLFSGDSEPGHDRYGWGNAYKLSEKKMDKWNDGTEAEAAAERHTIKNWEHVNRNDSILKEMAEFCRIHQVQLVLVTTPCWHTFYDRLDDIQLTKMYEQTHQFVQEYNLPYFDYLKDPRFDADDFYDSNHLSDVGAIKFTKILDEDIACINEASEN